MDPLRRILIKKHGSFRPKTVPMADSGGCRMGGKGADISDPVITPEKFAEGIGGLIESTALMDNDGGLL